MDTPHYKSGNCTICEKYCSLLHWHHTVPQSLGGKDSLQIPLCSNCHNILHANADALVAKIKSGKEIKRSFWECTKSAENAQRYVGIIVDAVLHASETQENKEYKLQVSVPSDLHAQLRILKEDLSGVSNLSDTVLFCIHETLSRRGLLNVNTKENRVQSDRITKKSAADLW